MDLFPTVPDVSADSSFDLNLEIPSPNVAFGKEHAGTSVGPKEFGGIATGWRD